MSAFEFPRFALDDILTRALTEDLGAGDVTTEACVTETAQVNAHGVAREALVVCGVPLAARVFGLVDASLRVEAQSAEGAVASRGTVLWAVTGRARGVLMAERVALNFVQRLSGIATLTKQYVDAVPENCATRITDTRKTTPGLRVLERYAVRCGGGKNHRYDLGSAVLIKDNHIAASGGVRIAIEAARARATHTSRIECEVDSLAQLEEALSARVDIVLLDNMSTSMVEEAVRLTRGRAVLEASGGITFERVAELARAGVDAISVGALTHSARAVDIGLDFIE